MCVPVLPMLDLLLLALSQLLDERHNVVEVMVDNTELRQSLMVSLLLLSVMSIGNGSCHRILFLLLLAIAVKGLS